MTVSSTLDAEARRASMAEDLARNGELELQAESERWQVHPMTIRRDFDVFVRAGTARRVRGGVVTLGADDFSQRRNQHVDAKQAIADKLLTLIRPDTAVGMDSSTTVYRLAERFTGAQGNSIVTNGLSAFQALHGREGLKAYLTGGEREEQNISLVGPLAELCVAQFNLDRCFLSTMSLDPEYGTSESTLDQVAFKKAMAGASREVVLAVDSSKFETRSRFRSLPLAGIDILVTELDPAHPHLDPYRNRIPAIL